MVNCHLYYYRHLEVKDYSWTCFSNCISIIDIQKDYT